MDGTPKQHESFSQRLKQAYSLKKNLKLLFIRPSDHVAEIDGLRALSILMVIIAHLIFFAQPFYPPTNTFAAKLPPVLRYIENGGLLGVCVFFVISGYLIASLLLNEYKQSGGIKISHFYYRRFLRLMPVYWLTLLAGVILGFPNLNTAWANVVYLTNFIHPAHQYLGWTWSLAVEEQFYFIFPAGLLIFFQYPALSKHPCKVVLVLFGFFIGLGIFLVYWFNLSQPVMDLNNPEFHRFGKIIYTKPFTGFSAILSGIVIAYLECYANNLKKIATQLKKLKLIDPLFLLALIIITSCILISDPGQPGIHMPKALLGCYSPIFAIGVAYVIFYMRSDQSKIALKSKQLLSVKWLYFIAQISYSAYLFHLLIIIPVYFLLKTANPAIRYPEMLLLGGVICVPLIAITGTLSYLFLERPFMNIRRR